MLNIPFYRPSIGEAETCEVIATLRSGWLTTGPRTKDFEVQFANYLGRKHAVALNSCTAALHLALEAVGVQARQSVVVPTMTFAASAEVVRYLGAEPILADCREEDFNLDVTDAERRIESALAEMRVVRAIVPVHYGGQIGDVEGVSRLAQKYQLKVIEDAAHCCPAFFREEPAGQESANGSQRPGFSDVPPTTPAARRRLSAVSGHGLDGWVPVGSGADVTCFSFYANKCITTGEGGMACTDSDAYAQRMRIMSLHGISKEAWNRFAPEGTPHYEIVAPGYKYNMTDIAAAIGIHQLRRADELHRKRRNIAALYTRLLGEIAELILPRELPGRIHSWHLYALRLKLDRLVTDRDEVVRQLKEQGIGTSVHWMPLHMHPYYRERYGYAPEDFPVAARLYPQIITLPLFPDMKPEEVDYVCGALKTIVARSLKGRRGRQRTRKTESKRGQSVDDHRNHCFLR